MGNDVADTVETRPYPYAFQVHCLMCTELMKLVDRISKVFPEIEAARPRCSSGIQALCLLNRAIEKAKLLLQYCSESSKLYLAITGDAIVSRCERSRILLEQSLSQIQNIVPIPLAVEISRILDDLRSATFILDSSEEEAGKVVRALLQPDTSLSDSVENSEIEAVQFAALRLHITSSKALVTEKRSIKKLLDKFGDSDQTKKKILKYLMHLLKKHGKLLMRDQTENDFAQQDRSFPLSSFHNGSVYTPSVEVESFVSLREDEGQTDGPIPPEEFKCPISLRLMCDPVVIASGQTFERMWIQKWFDEGRDTCPKTKKKLPNLSMTPNTVMKDLISKWCMKHGISIYDPFKQLASVHSWETSSMSIVSFGSSMNDICLPVDVSNVSLGSSDTSYISDFSHVKSTDGFNLVSMQTNDDSRRYRPYADMSESNQKFLFELESLAWESQQKVVEDVISYLKYNDQSCHFISAENFFEPLIRYLKDACDLHDVKAQKAGLQLLLAFVNKSRNEISHFPKDIYSHLACLLDSEVVKEALAVMLVMSCNKNCRSKFAASGALIPIVKILDTQTKDYQEAAIKILYNMSSNRETRPYIISLDCIPKLVPFLTDGTLARYCIIILKDLCDIEEARVSIAETGGCIASIAELLEIGSHEDQEHAVAVLLALCSQRDQYCQLVMDEGVLPSVCNISINGNDRGKGSAMELLRLLRDINFNDMQESSESDLDNSGDSSNHSNGKKSTSKASGFFRRKFSVFSKSSSKKK